MWLGAVMLRSFFNVDLDNSEILAKTSFNRPGNAALPREEFKEN